MKVGKERRSAFRAWMLLLAGILFVSNAIFAAPAISANQKMYFRYTQFKKLTSLYPRLKTAVLASLTPAGQKLWAQGTMRVPEDANVVKGDFNGNGKTNIAFVVKEKKSIFLLIAEKGKGGWEKGKLLKLKSAELPVWNGKALKLGDKSFVAWSGNRYKQFSGPLALYQYGYSVADFRGVIVKFTYIGPQNHPYPGLLIYSYFRLPEIAEFKKFRTKGISYGNDDMKALWTLALPPEKLATMVSITGSSELIASAEDRDPVKLPLHHSLSIIDTSSSHRPNHYEVFLKGEETVLLLKRCASRIKNPDAAGLFKQYNFMFGG